MDLPQINSFGKVASAISTTTEPTPNSPSTPNTKKAREYPDPLVIPPLSTHESTLILLHGKGSNGPKFGLEFIAAQTSTGRILPQLSPNTKFIFPTAKKRRAVTMNRATIHQWFDNVSVSEGKGKVREDLQIEGVRETGEYIRGLIEQEVKLVGNGKVVLGGLSQGCAAGLCVMLGLAGEAEGYLGGFIGMSGWLPWRTRLEEILRQETDEEDNDNPFGTDGDEGAEETTEMQAVNYLRDVMDLPPLSLSTFSCLFPPVFLGHGKTDEKVPFALGNEASATLKRLGMDVEWKEYDIGHWYLVPDEIDDIVTFLNRIAAL
jgi:predicted esterase